MNLKEKVESQMAAGKDVNLDAQSTAEEEGDGAAPVQADPDEGLKTSSTVPLSERIKQDSVLAATPGNSDDSTIRRVSESVADAAKFLPASKFGFDVLAGDGDITILPEHKVAFIQALTTNDRYRESLQLYGKALRVTFRSRTQRESMGLFSVLNYELRTGALRTQPEYAVRLRHLILALQVESLNGVEFPPVEEPITVQAGPDGEVAPTWTTRSRTFDTMPDALAAMLFEKFRLFEARYLTLIESGEKQNFF